MVLRARLADSLKQLLPLLLAQRRARSGRLSLEHADYKRVGKALFKLLKHLIILLAEKLPDFHVATLTPLVLRWLTNYPTHNLNGL